MKVKRLELKGFRGFDEIVLDFDTSPQRPTVFIGNNGVGKSSILDALVIVLLRLIKEIELNVNNSNNLKSKEQVDANSITDVDVNYYVTTDYKYRENNSFEANIFEKIIIEYQSEEFSWFTSSKILGNISTVATVQIPDNNLIDEIKALSNKICENITNSVPIIIYYPVSRSVTDVSLESQDIISTKSIDAYKNNFGNKGSNFKIFFEWFRNIEDLENENRRDDRDYRNKQLDSVREAIHELIPEFNNLRVRRNPLRMTVNKNAQELIIDQLSDGEKCLLAMVGDIARRLAIANPSLDNPLQGEGIVLIDEIELHLHPSWQRKIIPRLTQTFPNCQFIITTHSPQVLSQVHSENIYILQSTDKGIIASHPESSYGRDSNQILENLMDTPKRPKEFQEKILELFRLIDRNDFTAAKQLRQSLEEEIGDDEPELLRAGGVIKRKEILGR